MGTDALPQPVVVAPVGVGEVADGASEVVLQPPLAARHLRVELRLVAADEVPVPGRVAPDLHACGAELVELSSVEGFGITPYT